MPSSKTSKKTVAKKAVAKKAPAKKAPAKKKAAAPKKLIDNSSEENVVTLDRRDPIMTERRGSDLEASDVSAMPKPRRKKQRRRHIDPTTCERDYNNDEIEFMRAMDDYKHDSGRMFPTCSEILEVVRKIGYVRLSNEQAAMLDMNRTVEDCEEMMGDFQVDELEEALEA